VRAARADHLRAAVAVAAASGSTAAPASASASAVQIAKAALLHQPPRQGGILGLHLPMPFLAGQPILPFQLLLQPPGQDLIGVLVGLRRSCRRGGLR